MVRNGAQLNEMVAHRCSSGYGPCMTPGAERPMQWWILSPDDEWPDGDGDLDRLRAAVRHDWAVFAGEGNPPDVPPVALAISTSQDGRKICTGVIVGLNEAYPTGDGAGSVGLPVEVTSRALRSIPIAELIGRAVHDDRAPERHAGFRALVESRMPTTVAAQRTPGPKGHPDEHFKQVADLYRAALKAEPRRPMTWLAARYPGVNRSTVARWVQRARDRGFLGEASAGRAGETTEEQ
jgi:hypothetical protein